MTNRLKILVNGIRYVRRTNEIKKQTLNVTHKKSENKIKNGLPSPVNFSFLLHFESVSCGSILVSIFAHIKNKAKKYMKL